MTDPLRALDEHDAAEKAYAPHVRKCWEQLGGRERCRVGACDTLIAICPTGRALAAEFARTRAALPSLRSVVEENARLRAELEIWRSGIRDRGPCEDDE